MTVRPRVLGISGSLRARSTNAAVLRTAATAGAADVDVVLYDGLAELPHFNQDDDVAPLPAAVEALRSQVRDADALLLSTPEYAGALPGSFKNALDWLIGDGTAGSIYEKPVAWINASPRGATDAHESLRKVLGYAHARVVDAACIQVPVTSSMIAADGTIGDPGVRHRIAEAVRVLARRAERPSDS